jgi:glycosyltransferase involved in cell wall biosynthesis
LACDDVEVTGRVPDVAPYLQQADVVLCPLRVGGGVKVKVLEALRAGKAIVSTPVGCQGLGAARGAVRVATTAGHFAAATAELLNDAPARAAAERRAAAAPLPTWDAAAEALADCWERAARRSLAVA